MQDVFNEIIDHIAKGATIAISTHLKCWYIDAKTLARYRERTGEEMIYVKGKSLYMRQGRGAACCNYCKISVFYPVVKTKK